MGALRHDDVARNLPAGSSRVGTYTMLKFEAGPVGMVVLDFGAPIGEDDSEIVPGWWSD